MKDVTRTLARFVAQTQWEDIPPKVRQGAKRAQLVPWPALPISCLARVKT